MTHVIEFFAGIGLARTGLERAGFETVWANDIEPHKRAIYAANHPADDFVLADIRSLESDDIPAADLAWSSFPCTDLSLAGRRAGITGARSSMFGEFVRLIEPSPPTHVVVENVTALASLHGGAGLRHVVAELGRIGYSCDIVVIDAARFSAQSRPRLFVLATTADAEPTAPHYYGPIVAGLRTHRVNLPVLPERGRFTLADVVDESDESWWGWDTDRVETFVDMLDERNTARLGELIGCDSTSYRAAARRTRAALCWEIRGDELAGAIRTAGGSSSRQALVRAGHGRLDVRWLSVLESARLMGAGDYDISGVSTTRALNGLGDGVHVDVVEWLARHAVAR